MDDSYWKKKAEELPHFAPAHEVQKGKSLEDILGTLPGAPQQNPNNQDGSWGREIDITSRFAGMLPKSKEELMAYQMMRNGPRQQQVPQETGGAPAEMVYLREGQTAYRKLQGTDYSTVPLAACMGPIAGVVGKEFKLVGLKEFYIVENQRQAVDLANLDYSKMKRLAVVEAPFLGTMLVPESAVVRRGPSGRQVLKG